MKTLSYSLITLASIFALFLGVTFFHIPFNNFLADTSGAGPTTYYVAPDGDDTHSGTSADQAWSSIGQVNNVTLQAGDSVLFKRGGTYLGTLNMRQSGSSAAPIKVGAYGDGDRPILSGFQTPTDWKNDGNGIWESVCSGCGSLVNMVVINGAEQAMGRYPNTGYLNVQSHDNNASITDNAISSMPDWTGGDVVIRKNHWIIDRNKITGQSGNTISYASASKYSATDGYGYFIENHIKTLDKEGEWYYDGNTKTFFLYTNQDPSNQNVLVASVDSVINVSNQNNIVFDGLTIEGSNQKTVSLVNATGITIQNSAILFSGTNGIDVTNVGGLTVQNNTIAHTNNNAFTTRTCTNCSIIKNAITDTAMIPGMGKSADGNGYGINISGTGNRVANNTVTNTGYIGINFNGQDSVVENNTVNGFASVKDDGGGIYLWTSTLEPQYTNRTIRNNIVINGVGASSGAYDEARFALDTKGYNTAIGTANGIYLDDNAAFAEVTGNTIANNNGQGIFIHNAHDFTIANNTIVNNTYGQILMAHDTLYPNSPIRNVVLKGNTLLSSKASQLSLKLMSPDNDFDKFGTFTNNGYFRPSADADDIAFVQQVTAGKRPTAYYNLTQLQSTLAVDTGSTAVNFSVADAPLFQYNASSSSTTLSLDGAYKDLAGKVSTNSITIPAFGSVALLKTTVQPVDTTPSETAPSNNGVTNGTGGSGGTPLTTTVTNTSPVVSTPSQVFVTPPPVTVPVPPATNLVVPTVASGFWSFLPFISSTPKPAPIITPAAPALHTNIKTGKKSYDVVSAEYALNGTIVHTATTYPDNWSLDTATLADGSYTLSSTYHYSDGTTDNTTSTFTVDNSPTILERIVGFIGKILNK